jgi:hypothetical protein
MTDIHKAPFVVHEDNIEFLKNMTKFQKDLQARGLDLQYVDLDDFGVWKIVDPANILTYYEIITVMKQIYRDKN